MEEGGGGGFGYGFLERNPHSLRPTPPLTAIERFLWNSSTSSATTTTTPNDDLSLQKQISRKRREDEALLAYTNSSSNGFCEPSYFDGGVVAGLINNCASNSFDQQHQDQDDMSFVDGLFADEMMMMMNNSTSSEEMNIWGGDVDHGEQLNKNGGGGGVGKRAKDGSYTIDNQPVVVKGQWTDIEDSLLVSLVNEYGERKWAQIAHKLRGRAGKQCRERWHNHLRPNIKKDTWSEEEEIMLVEAHQKIGNRWAEIAKRIPGRTENAIKNHWNATKRRLISLRRKSKKTAISSTTSAAAQGSNSHRHQVPSILQDYIQSIICNIIENTIHSAPNPPPNQFDCPNPEIYSESSFTDDSSSLLDYNTYDDDLLFIQNYLENRLTEEPMFHHDNHEHLQNPTTIEVQNISSTANNTTTSPPPPPPPPHLYSDLYLSYLLNGVNSNSSLTNEYYNHYEQYPDIGFLSSTGHDQQAAVAGYDDLRGRNNKEMDLIEMVSAAGCSFQTRNSSRVI